VQVKDPNTGAKPAILAKPPCALPATLVVKDNYSAYNATVEEVSGDGESKGDNNTSR